MPITIDATYRITTPMFCGGADQSPELRLPSFKGVLRFWWRSLQAGLPVADVRKREAELFGSAEQKVGQSKVRMRLVAPQEGKLQNSGEVFEGGRLGGCHYLGYGVMEAFGSNKKGTKAGELTRGVMHGGEFRVGLRLRCTEEQAQGLIHALILTGTLGGLGSKARKGFGSLTLTRLEEHREGESHERDLPTDPAERLREVFSTDMPEESQIEDPRRGW